MAGQLIKRGDSWLIRLYLGRDDRGKRQYLNHTVKGSRKEAERVRTQLDHEKNVGRLTKATRLTLSGYLQQWLETSCTPRLRGRSVDDYRDSIRLYVTPTLGQRKLKNLSAIDVRRLYLRLRENGLSPRTVRKTHAALHAALEQAVKDCLIPTNVARLAADALPRQERKERSVLSPESAGRFVEAVSEARHAAYWLLLLGSGIRPGEALALRWTDLDGVTVRIQRALVDRRGRLSFEEPKTSKSRRAIPLPNSVIAALKSHRGKQLESRLRVGKKWMDLDLMFSARNGAPLRQSNLHAEFKRILKRAGLPNMRVYDLRHSCATILLAGGESPKVVAERLGHSSTTLTLDTYSHVLPDMQEKATAKFEALVFAAHR